MLKVAIKYCGGCNPGYDRVALADYIKNSLYGRVEFVSLDGNAIDLVLAIQGCKTCCTDLSLFEGIRIRFISQIEDAGKFLQEFLNQKEFCPLQMTEPSDSTNPKSLRGVGPYDPSGPEAAI